MVFLSMSYFYQKMKLFANKLYKLRLFWFLDYALTKKQNFFSTAIQQNLALQFFKIG